MNKNIKLNLINILSWTIGILLLIAGLSTLEKSILGGIFMMLASLITIPIILNFTQKKFNFSFSRTIKIIAVIVLLIVSSIFLPKKTEIIPTPQNNNVSENTNVPVEAENSTQQINNEIITANQEVKNVQEVKSVTPAQKTATSPNSQYKYYAVSTVVDGDTIKVNKDGSIITLRLIGLDTPETVDPRKPVQCFGKEASNKAKELLLGKKIRIESDSTQGTLDKYGRTLAYVYREDGLFYNKYMVEQGYAHEYTYNLPYKYQSEFKTAQKYAQANLLGLWAINTCNGNTTTSAVTATSASSSASATTTTSTGKYYTSSYSTSKYYYPETCDGWKSLNTKYLKSFNTLDELLKTYPNRTPSSQC